MTTPLSTLHLRLARATRCVLTASCGALLAAMFLLGGASVCRASQAPTTSITTVEMLREVRLGPGAIRLGDIATVTGANADAIAGLVLVTAAERAGSNSSAKSADEASGQPILPDSAAQHVVELQAVRDVLAANRVNPARLTVSGAKTVVLIGAASAPNPLIAPPSAAPVSTPPSVAINAALTVSDEVISSEIAYAATPDRPTLRSVVLRELATMYNAAAQDLRMEFENTPSARHLDLPLPELAEASIVPQAAPGATRLPLRAEIRRQDGSVDVRLLTVRVEMRRSVAVATGPIERGELISEESLRTEVRWVNPASEAPLSVSRTIGSAAKRRIDAGRMVTRADVQPPVVVQRGDTIWVQARQGTVGLMIKAKAMSTARDGETVTLQSLGSKQTFVAIMEGRRATVDFGVDYTATAEPAPSSVPQPMRSATSPISDAAKNRTQQIANLNRAKQPAPAAPVAGGATSTNLE